jgi:DNA-binding response OmpR family regulator
MSLKSLGVTSLEVPDDQHAVAPGKSRINPPPRILLIEDDTAIRQLCLELLIGSGYQVDTAEDGEAGLKVLHAASHDPDSYDLLITDNNMPKLSGVGLIKKLRSERTPLPPVILASGTIPPNIEQLRLAAILLKPFDAGQLVQTVREVLRTANSDLEYVS